MNNNMKFKQELVAYILLIVGSILFAVGDVMFVNPYLMAPGGTYGLSNVFNTLWPWKISLYAICMDIPLLIVGTWILGPKFGILIFAFTFVLESWWGYNPVIHDGAIATTAGEGTSMVQIPHDGGWFQPDYFLNTVLAGLIYGLAIGLIFRSGATSGGSDIRFGHHLDDSAQVHEDFARHAGHDCRWYHHPEHARGVRRYPPAYLLRHRHLHRG